MKTLVIFLCLLTFHVNGQNLIKKFNIDCFIIGLAPDYMGRSIAPDHEIGATFMVSFNFDERNMERVFQDSIQKYYRDLEGEIMKSGRSYYNRTISANLNEYYTSEIDSGFYSTDDKGKSYQLYKLVPNPKKFNTVDKKLSFLSGIFLSCGTFENGIVKIENVNSDTFNLAVSIVQELGFEYSENEKCLYCTPMRQILIFKPTKDFVAFFRDLNRRI